MRSCCTSRLLLAHLLLLSLLGLGRGSVAPATRRPAGAAADDALEQRPISAEARKHKHHQLLFFMGGLKSLVAIVLIKIKIVLAVAAIVAVSVFTVKYLLGATTGLPDPAGLFYKGGAAPPSLPPPPPPPVHHPPHGYLQPSGHHPELYQGAGVVHDPVYDYGYPTSIPWDQTSHENHGNDWSKIGDGGRRLHDMISSYPKLEKVSLQNYFNQRRKRR